MQYWPYDSLALSWTQVSKTCVRVNKETVRALEGRRLAWRALSRRGGVTKSGLLRSAGGDFSQDSAPGWEAGRFKLQSADAAAASISRLAVCALPGLSNRGCDHLRSQKHPVTTFRFSFEARTTPAQLYSTGVQ